MNPDLRFIDEWVIYNGTIAHLRGQRFFAEGCYCQPTGWPGRDNGWCGGYTLEDGVQIVARHARPKHLTLCGSRSPGFATCCPTTASSA